ncbi:MAG: ABC transporter permease subunit [Chloroflexota bacterium]
MNIFKHEFKMNLKSVAIWSVSIALLILIYLSAFTSVSADAEMMTEVMASFPEELLIAFGMTDMDWSSVLGFYGVVFLFCQVCLSIQAANYGFSLVSIEERELTADFLLAKPIGRPKILTSKLLAALTGLTITNIVVWISSFIVIDLVRDGREYALKPLVLLLLSIVVFQLFFLTVGMLISLLMKRVRSVTPLSMALAFGMYVLSAFGGMLGDDTLEIISPFKHFDPNYILKNGAYDTPLVLISVMAILISIVGSYVLYSKRNIQSAV